MATKKNRKASAINERNQERWMMEGRKLKVSAHQWRIADWILRGMKIFKSKKRAYDEAVKLTGMTRETLQQFKLTAERFPNLTRVKELTFGHHRVVANRDKDETPEKRKWLLLKYGTGESIEGLVAGLKGYDADKEDSRNLSTADVAANKIVGRVEAFTKFIGNAADFDTVLDDKPETRHADLLKALKDAVTRLDAKIVELENAWRGHEQASEETNAMGAGA